MARKLRAVSGDFIIWVGLEDVDLFDCKEWKDWELHAFQGALEKKHPALREKMKGYFLGGAFEQDGLVFQYVQYPYDAISYAVGFGVAVFSANRGKKQGREINLDAVIRKIQKVYPEVVKAFREWGMEEDPHVCTRLLIDEEDFGLSGLGTEGVAKELGLLQR